VNGPRLKALRGLAFAAMLAAAATGMAMPTAQAAARPAHAKAGLATTAIAGQLNGVSAASSSNAWAVGENCPTTCTTLTVHWNGMAWSQVASPNAGTGANSLSGVYTVSASNAWAVGSYCTTSTCGVEDTLILHWNGSTWSKVKSPNPSSLVNVLTGVSGTSNTDIWAAGYMIGASGSDNTLIVHWNGMSWSKVKSPNPSKTGANFLNAVSAVSSGNAWAVGGTDSSTGTPVNLALHWDGMAWSRTKTPTSTSTSLGGVSATSATNAWAVGGAAVILRWNGTSWSKVTNPHPTGASTGAVSADSSTDAWAVGDYCVSSCGGPGAVLDTLTLHWNGSSWSQIPSPSPSTTGRNLLFGASAISTTNAWAVGSNPNGTTLILHWNGASWSQA
jgi:hypothetical protein